MHSLSCRRDAFLLCFAALGTAFILGPAAAQTGSMTDEAKEAARRILSYERSYSEVMENLEYLSDRIGPRLTGSERLRRANDWTAEKMRAYGLENVHLESYTIPRGWERGTVEARIVQNGLPVSAAQMAWTPGTRGKIIGPVVLFAPESEADLAAFKGRLRGAIVLTSRGTGQPTPEGMMSWPGSKPLPPIPALAQDKKEDKPAPQTGPTDFRRSLELRRKITEFMQKEGVAAVLRDAGKPQMLLNMTGSWESRFGAATVPTLFVAHEHIAMIQRLLSRNLPLTMELKVTCKSVPGPVTVYNTVGEIRGTEKPDEIVLLGAHLDSWDLGTGSTDNGTGSMAVLEAAKLIKSSGIAPKRTIRFVLFSGEEEGLVGSEMYVKAHKAEMPKVDVVFVHDTGTGRVKGAWLQNRAECKPMLEQQFAFLNDLGLLTDTPNLLPGKMNGTDHASFDAVGVPAFAFNQEPIEYGLTHHSQSDTFDKARPDDLKQGACVLAILASNAALMPETYPRAAVKASQ
jgi:hypothetical protein